MGIYTLAQKMTSFRQVENNIVL